MDPFYRNVFCSIPGLVCLVAPDLTVVDANPEFLETQSEGGVKGMNFCQFLPNPLDKPYFMRAVLEQSARHVFDPMNFQTTSGLLSFDAYFVV